MTSAVPIAERLSTISDQLYAAPAEEFVALRKDLATTARKSGDRELATAIGELRRPTRSAWVVNLLAREAAEEVQGLLDLASALRQAQQQLSGPDLRRLSGERHRAVEALAGRAATLAAEHQVAVSESTRREVVQALQAALADEAVAAQLRAGHLAQVPEYGGFGPFGTAAAPPAGPAPTSESSGPDAAEPGESAAPDAAAVQEAERARAEAVAALDTARQATSSAERAVADAKAEHDRLVEAEREAREALARAESDSAEAARQLDQARDELEKRRSEEQQAQEQLDSET